MIDRAWYFASPVSALRARMGLPEIVQWTAREAARVAHERGLEIAAVPERAPPGSLWSPACYFAGRVAAGLMPDDGREIMRHCAGAATLFGGLLWLRSPWSADSVGMAAERQWFSRRGLPVVEV